MHSIFETVVLGIIQGLTEFLPVSSSGHIEIAKYFFGDDMVGEDSMMLTVVLHFATALSTIVVFRSDIVSIVKNLFSGIKSDQLFALYVIISMIPAAIVGLVFEDFIESLFGGNLVLVAFMLLVTGLLLYVADRAKNTVKDITLGTAFIVGVAQAIAILPGISRSGATIATSVMLGVDREKAARFSFLMVVPLIFGKIAKDLLSGELMASQLELLPLLCGFVAAFVTGFIACKWMISLVKNSQLKYFSYWCFVVAAVVLFNHFI